MEMSFNINAYFFIGNLSLILTNTGSFLQNSGTIFAADPKFNLQANI